MDGLKLVDNFRHFSLTHVLYDAFLLNIFFVYFVIFSCH